MIVIHINFHGAINRHGHAQDCAIEAEDGATVDALLRSIGYSDREARFVVAMIAGERLHPKHPLCNGDRIDLLAPAGGG